MLLSPVGPRVVDFGIAPAVEATIGPHRRPPGPVQRCLPRARADTGGVAGPPADVFAWGATVAWTGTGRNPYGGGSAASVAYRAVHDRPDLGGLPPCALGRAGHGDRPGRPPDRA